MPRFYVYGSAEDDREFMEIFEADDRYHVVVLAQKAWPNETIEQVNDDVFAGYEAISGLPLFMDDDFTAEPDGDGGWLLKRRVDTTAEDAR